jgi:hypothetical protein
LTGYSLFFIVLVFTDGSRGAFDDQVLTRQACDAQVEALIEKPRYLSTRPSVAEEIPVCFSLTESTIEFWRGEMHRLGQ